jgi:hypothetical protein
MSAPLMPDANVLLPENREQGGFRDIILEISEAGSEKQEEKRFTRPSCLLLLPVSQSFNFPTGQTGRIESDCNT